jgi:hypothetical protein
MSMQLLLLPMCPTLSLTQSLLLLHRLLMRATSRTLTLRQRRRQRLHYCLCLLVFLQLMWAPMLPLSPLGLLLMPYAPA